MKKFVMPAVLVAGLSASLFVGATSVSWAQERKPVAVTAEKACGTVTLTFVNPNTDVAKTHVFTWNAVAGNVVTAEGKRSGDVTVPPAKTVKETIRFTEDEFNGIAAVTVNVTAGPDSDIQPKLDLFPIDTDCALPGTTPDPTEEPEPTETPDPTTTPPTTTPEPTDEPDPTTTPAPPADNDDDNGAQVDDGLNPGPIVPSFNDSVVTPVGGVETGGGPE